MTNMETVVVNVYACCPGMGSELGIGWNWCVELARHCELHIITESEFREKIEAAVTTLEQGRNMHFHYLPVTERVRRMCWNQGDWRFYHYYKQWQKKAANLAREICRQEKIDILHQLNMQGFREPGYLWQVSQETDIPFVWGPIGGLKQFPMAYAKDGSWKMCMFFRVKNLLNRWQLKHDRRVDKAMRQASLLIASIPDSYKAIKETKGLEPVIIPDTGSLPVDTANEEQLRFQHDTMTIVWAGKFDFRKRLDLAIKAVAETGIRQIRLKVFGSGNSQQTTEAKALADRLHVTDSIEWMGNCPNATVKAAMQQADLFLFTSVNEETSTVVMEAVGCRLPVLCFDCCGMSAVVTEDVGVKIPLTTPQQSVKDFARQITFFFRHRDTLATMSANCRKRAEELSWENKARQMARMYNDVVIKTLVR